LNAITFLTIIIVLFFTAFGMSSPLITLYLENLGSNYAQISLILASAGLVSLLGNYIWGRVSDRLGRRKPLIAGGLFGGALAYAVLSQVTHPAAAWAARLFEAAALAAYTTASLALMGDLLGASEPGGGGPDAGNATPDTSRPARSPRSQRGVRMGVYRGAGSLAFALGAVVGGRLADAYSLRVTLGGSALLYATAGLVALALREVSRPVQPATHAVPDSTDPEAPLAVSQRRASLPLAFLAGAFLWTGAWMGATSMWPLFMVRLGYSKSAISSLWGLAAFVEAPAMFLVGRLSDLFGRAPLLAAGGIGAAAVMIGWVLLARYLPALLGVQVARGFAFASFTATAMTFVTEQGEQEVRGRNSGVYNATTGAGQLLGLLMAGTMAQRWGFTFMFVVLAAGGLLSALCFLALRWARVPGGRALRRYPQP
jgi:PPP family 3-phenylpropionic acid transporter